MLGALGVLLVPTMWRLNAFQKFARHIWNQTLGPGAQGRTPEAPNRGGGCRLEVDRCVLELSRFRDNSRERVLEGHTCPPPLWAFGLGASVARQGEPQGETPFMTHRQIATAEFPSSRPILLPS